MEKYTLSNAWIWNNQGALPKEDRMRWEEQVQWDIVKKDSKHGQYNEEERYLQYTNKRSLVTKTIHTEQWHYRMMTHLVCTHLKLKISHDHILQEFEPLENKNEIYQLQNSMVIYHWI